MRSPMQLQKTTTASVITVMALLVGPDGPEVPSSRVSLRRNTKANRVEPGLRCELRPMFCRKVRLLEIAHDGHLLTKTNGDGADGLVAGAWVKFLESVSTSKALAFSGTN
eukprot:6206189-Pleurochrysis_carterae.AAC.3